MDRRTEPAADQGGSPPGGHALSDAEALMWRAEADPWLSSSVGVLAVLDRPVDHEALRRRVAAGILGHPDLSARVVSARVVDGGMFGAPRLVPDPDVDLDHHLRHLTLPSRSDDRAVLDLACRLVEDPLDRSRPLWRMWTVSGLKGGRGALVWKLHHVLTDGQGALGLAELFVDLERSPAATPALDPALLRERLADRPPASPGRAPQPGGGGPLGTIRRLAADALLTGADPTRLRDQAAGLVGEVQRLGRQLGGDGAGSAAWATRSRQRHLSAVRLPLARFRSTARALGGTVNDLFVAVVVHGVAEAHRQVGEELDRVAVSFIVSTRSDGSGRNAFVPVRMAVPVAGLDAVGRFHATRAALAEHRTGVRDDGLVGLLTGVAATLPTGVLTRAVRRQAAGLDVATSCLRGPELPLFVGGGRVGWVVPIGPVAGTPVNITALTYNKELTIGVHADPVAVGDPGLVSAALESAYCELVRAV